MRVELKFVYKKRTKNKQKNKNKIKKKILILIKVANKFAFAKGYEINASQELIALGMCNMLGCWFKIYPITGGLSRSAVSEAAGAQTPLNSLISGIVMLLSVEFLLSIVYYLPQPVLGSIVIIAVTGLFDFNAMKHLYILKKKDFIVMLSTLISTLILGIEMGVLIGVIVSLFIFIQRASNPHYAILGKLGENSNIYRNIKNYNYAIIQSDLLIFRWDSSIFFGNIAVFKTTVDKYIYQKNQRLKLANHSTNKVPPLCLILCFSGINDIDASGAEQFVNTILVFKQMYPNLTILITG